MNLSIEREKLLAEIQKIPEAKLSEAYILLHSFRLRAEAARRPKKTIMQYAGCWRTMPDELFADFSHEIVTRRRDAFSRRGSSETRVN